MTEVKEQEIVSIYLSGDNTSAYINLLTEEQAPELVKSEIHKCLEEVGVVFGINDEVIESISSQGEMVSNVLIATYQKPVHGKDAVVHYKFEVDHEITPKQLENGAVDYKDMGYVLEVEKDTVLVEIEFETDGVEGTDVLGNPIEADNGKPANVRAGKNCRVSEDGKQIIADASGIILMDENTITISDTLEIYEDVGVGTGNIVFGGAVNVHGSVLPGMSIRCGKLNIDGMVEGATIEVSGDVEVNQGIQGHEQANILCGGTLKAKYISNARIKVQGNLESDLIINSQIECGKAINLSGRKGCAIGGKISVCGDLKAKKIGSEMGVATKIVLGQMTTLLEEIKAVEAGREDLEATYKKIEQCIKVMEYKLKKSPNSTNYREMIGKYTRNKFITQSGINKEHDKLLRLHNKLTESGITTMSCDKIYPGTTILVGHESLKIDEVKKHFTVKSVRGQLVTE